MPVMIPTKRLDELGYNPFENCPWGCKVSKVDVLTANHRVAAAIIRGDALISAHVSGSIDYAKELLGVDVEEYFQEDAK